MRPSTEEQKSRKNTWSTDHSYGLHGAASSTAEREPITASPRRTRLDPEKNGGKRGNTSPGRSRWPGERKKVPKELRNPKTRRNRNIYNPKNPSQPKRHQKPEKKCARNKYQNQGIQLGVAISSGECKRKNIRRFSHFPKSPPQSRLHFGVFFDCGG